MGNNDFENDLLKRLFSILLNNYIIKLKDAINHFESDCPKELITIEKDIYTNTEIKKIYSLKGFYDLLTNIESDDVILTKNN